MVFRPLAVALLLGLTLPTSLFAAPPKKEEDLTGKPVSFYRQIRPIFQANCQGCHQPAKARGGYVMTNFEQMLAGGEEAKKEQKPAIVPGQSEASTLVQLITPVDGKAEMPPKKAPLLEPERALISRWIAEGAKDDTPENAKQRFSAERPPTYTAPAVVTSLDFSPDGKLLAVAGFHEVLLWKADGSALEGRLVGLSERVQMVRFSPDGKLLATAAGRPAQMGEIQVWDVAARKLLQSVPQGYDTLYGVSWSPDGTKLAFGCPDNSVRAVDVKTGQQVMMMSSHSDWPLDTAWSTKGDHVISVSRDMSVKLTELATQRFVDNVTSITPGALRGGMNAIARHPQREEILIGGADGVPQIYRIFRTTARKIGDNANLLRRFPAMTGRIFAVGWAPDGKHCAAGSSLDGKGYLSILETETDAVPPEPIKAIMEKVVSSQTPAEKQQLEDYFTKAAKQLHQLEVKGGIYALAWSPDGQTLAAAGEDGQLWMVQPTTGKIARQFVPVPLQNSPPKLAGPAAATP